MNARTKRTEAIALAILIAGGVTYAAAQQQPAQPRTQPQSAQPNAQPQPTRPSVENTAPANASPQNCNCMQQGTQAGQNGMMGGQNNMHGQNGMIGGQDNMHGQNGMMGGQSGMMMDCGGDGASCPMANMHAMADVKIENTKNGALIRMNAKRPEQVAQIQQIAQRMTQCMGNAGPATTQPAAPATPSRTR
jgi:hypothetical protein